MRNSDLFDLCFYGGGNFTSKREWIHQERTINSNELIVVTKGEVFIEENGKRFTVKENEFLILYPNDVHMPQISCDSTEYVKKAVLKIAI